MLNPNMVSGLIGFAIAALIQLGMLSNIFKLLVDFIYEIFFQIPVRILDGIVSVFNQCGGGQLSSTLTTDCLLSAIEMANRNWANAGTDLINIINEFPFSNFVTFLIIWMFSTFLFRFILQYEWTQGQSWLESPPKFLNSNPVKNAIFFVIISIGAYFSFASIAAIPIFQQKIEVAEVFSADNLSQQLLVQIDQLEELFADVQRNDNVFVELEGWIDLERARIESYKNNLRDGTTTSNNGIPNLDQGFIDNRESLLRSITGDLADVQENYNRVINGGATMREISIIDLKEKNDVAVQAYQFAQQYRVGALENADYYIQLVSWFNSQFIRTSDALAHCGTEQRILERELRIWSESTAKNLDLTKNLRFAPSIGLPSDTGFDACSRVVINISRLPPRKPLGTLYSGPFGLLASWLLETESYSLVLITGMFGFGLLGAAASTVIRERDKPELIVSNLSDVVIRGTLAAVVVFLAAQGGLAIFVQGDAELNPYVVLLTCLVGAVFSEVIWERAKGFLQEQVKNKQAEGAEVHPEDIPSSPSPDRPEDKSILESEPQEEDKPQPE